MNKKIISLIIFILLIAVVGGIVFSTINNNNENTIKIAEKKEENENEVKLNQDLNESEEVDNDENLVAVNNTQVNNEEENDTENTNKVLVVYYSASGNTKSAAERIAQNLDADLFEIEPKDIYTDDDLNWNDEDSRVSKEHDDTSLRNVELKTTQVDNWENYDTVLIGYPIWWGIAAWPVDTFVKANDFSDKTVIPFCTSSSSGLGQSGKLLEEETNAGDWKTGIRFNSNPSDSAIKSWTDSIK